MAELLIKIGDNAPWKDLMLSLKTTEADAKQAWLDRYLIGVATKDIDAKVAKANKIFSEPTWYKHGDIIDVRPDGWGWGLRCSFPRFYIARIPNSQLELMGYHFSGPKEQLSIPEFLIPIQKDETVLFKRRNFCISDLSALKPDSIVEISSNLIDARQGGYTSPDAAKFVEHNTAGTFRIRASGQTCEYNTLSQFDAGEATDMATEGGGNYIADLYNDWSGYGLSEYVILGTDWTSDADNHLIVQASDNTGLQSTGADSHHNGSLNSGSRLQNSNNLPLLTINVDYTEIIGIEVKHYNTTINDHGLVINSADNCIIDSCIVKGGSASSSSAIRIESGSGTVVKNTLAVNSGGDAFYVGGTTTLLHCVAFACTNGFNGYSGASLDVSHSVAFGISSKEYNGSGVSSTYGYNAGEDGSEPGSNGVTLTTDPFIDSSGGDFTHGSGSELIDAGGSSGCGISTDCIGTARPQNTNYDIGWFEYVTAGTTYEQALYGSFPAPSGALSHREIYRQSIFGDMPAPQATLLKKIMLSLTGAMPAASAGLVKSTGKTVSGIHPAPAGALVKKTSRSVAGNMPAPSGDISTALTGLAQLVVGNMPAAVGGVVKKIGKHLTGNAPAASGEITQKNIGKNVTGDVPPPSGSSTSGWRTSQSTAGSMPAPTGLLSTTLNPIVSIGKLLKIIGGSLKKMIGG